MEKEVRFLQETSSSVNNSHYFFVHITVSLNYFPIQIFRQDNLKELKRELASAMLKAALAEHKENINDLEKINAQIAKCQENIDKEDTDKQAIRDEKEMLQNEMKAIEKESEMHEEEVKEMREK